MALRLVTNRAHARLLAASKGKLGSRIGGRPVLMLETRGRHSGRRRRSPVQYLRHESGLVVVASNAGRSEPPAWSFNLATDPIARALVDGRWLDVRGRFVEGEERRRLWALLSQRNPWLDGAAERARRELAVIVLVPGRPPHDKELIQPTAPGAKARA